VGLIADYERRAGFAHLKAGDALVLVGDGPGELGASLYLRECLGREDGAPPPVDLALELRTGDLVRALIAEGRATCVHDLADGGLAIAAAEMALASDMGLTLLSCGADAHASLFGEDQARYLVGARDPAPILAAAAAAGVACRLVGHAGGETFAAEGLFSIPLSRLRATHEGWLPRYMEGGAPAA